MRLPAGTGDPDGLRRLRHRIHGEYVGRGDRRRTRRLGRELDTLGQVEGDIERGELARCTLEQATEALERGEPPSLLAAGRFREHIDNRCFRQEEGHPIEPSICSSISRLSSSAYSIGSSRAIGSTKPRTIIAIASSSVRPRLIR